MVGKNVEGGGVGGGGGGVDESYRKILHATGRCAAVTLGNNEQLCAKDRHENTHTPTHT